MTVNFATKKSLVDKTDEALLSILKNLCEAQMRLETKPYNIEYGMNYKMLNTAIAEYEKRFNTFGYYYKNRTFYQQKTFYYTGEKSKS